MSQAGKSVEYFFDIPDYKKEEVIVHPLHPLGVETVFTLLVIFFGIIVHFG